MIQTLKKLWKMPTASRANAGGHDIMLAVTALMVKVMMMDGRLDDAEHNEIAAALHQRFELSEAEARQLIDRAATAADKAHDLYQFTSRIIKEYPIKERTSIIRELWCVAMADGHVDTYEEHLIRKISDLIGVEHRRFIDAKIDARGEIPS